MSNYILIEKEDTRVILISDRVLKEGETLLQSIDAPSWVDARIKVKEKTLYQNPGYGWFRR